MVNVNNKISHGKCNSRQCLPATQIVKDLSKKKTAIESYSALIHWDVTKTGNGERGTGNGERKSGNELSAETSIKIQNGRRSKIENRRNKLNR